jgi:enoyl-[acyl-carrier protein] reductase I
MGFLTGKKLLITGVLSNRSIAYGIAQACHAQGAELAFSYVGERFKDRITEFAADFGSNADFRLRRGRRRADRTTCSPT